MSSHTNRLDYLDAVRGFALVLGIIFHASLSYMPIFIGWAVMDIYTSSIIPIFVLISHSFRMELFFLVAGFFSHMSFHKQGLRSFATSRWVKLGIPLIIGWIVLRPLLVSGWIMGAESMQGEVNIGGALIQGFKTLGDIPNDLLTGTHLWFLYYLLVMTASLVAIRFMIELSPSVKSTLGKVSDHIVSWVCQSNWAIIVVAIPTATCLWFMQHWGMDTPDKSLIPNIPVSLIYGGFFIFGWLLHRQAELMQHFAKLSWIKLFFCVISGVIALKVSAYEIQLAHSHYIWIKAGFMFSYAILMWSLISLTIGVCKHLFKRPSKIIRYIADASYWLYLIHLPIVIWLQIVFAELPLHWSLKLLSICAITIGLSILIYDVLVRSTFIGAILNGKRKPRILFKRRTIKQVPNE